MKIGITERGDASSHFKAWTAKMDAVDGVIAVTKNPAFLLRKLRHYNTPLDKLVVHCTITGWGGTAWEPRVPSTAKSVAAYHEFVELLGHDRVVLRVDPIIPTRSGIDRVVEVLEEATAAENQRIRISFLDLYPHVRRRLMAVDTEDLFDVYDGKLHAPLWYRKRLLALVEELRGGCQEIEVCGEPGFDCVGCVSRRDVAFLEVELPRLEPTSYQRKACACLAMKTELLDRRKPCKHGCLYCYWKDA